MTNDFGNLILTNYPCSRAFNERIKEFVGADARSISLKELRQHSLTKMVFTLLTSRARQIYIPVEDETGLVLLPILKFIAALTSAREILTICPDFSVTHVSRSEAFGSLWLIFIASISARLAVFKAGRQVARLIPASRIACKAIVSSGHSILYLNANLWFGVKAGGSVGHISGVINALLKEKCQVFFASAGGRLMVNCDAKYLPLSPPRCFGMPSEFNHYLFHYGVLGQINDFALSQHIDFIYQRLSIANYSGVVLSRLLRIPLVIEYNGSEAWIAKNWGRGLKKQALAEKIEMVNLDHAHLIVTISDVLKDELILRGVDARRIVSYPNCIDPELFDPTLFTAKQTADLRSRYNIQPDAIVVTFIGTFGQWHGAEVMAKSIRRLIDEDRGWLANNRVHFLMVGDGLKMTEVRSALGEHANGEYVTLAGLVPQCEAPLHLAASDILLSPHVPNADGSRFFGSPTKLFEYMAMGKAILASDLDQIGDIFSGSVHVSDLTTKDIKSVCNGQALLCSPGDTEQIIKGILFLVEHPGLRNSLGVNARRLALEKFTWKHHVEAILQGLKRIELEASSRRSELENI